MPEENNTPPQRPENVPEKFWDAEKGAVNTDALLQSYSDLSTKLGNSDQNQNQNPNSQMGIEVEGQGDDQNQQQNQAGGQNQQQQQQDSDDNQNQRQADPVPQEFDKYTDEFETNGKLSDESYKELQEKNGLSKDFVDRFISMQNQQREQQTQAIYESVGGQEGYKRMIEWAAKNLSQEEIGAFDSQIESGDPNAAKLAVVGLSAIYQKANGNLPNLIGGDAPRAPVGRFENTQQVTAAMRDPRYKNDPAYRKEVEDKLANSTVFG